MSHVVVGSQIGADLMEKILNVAIVLVVLYLTVRLTLWYFFPPDAG
jgi:hypothetical protein